MAENEARLSETAVWQALAQVMDPEIPAVSLVEMGIIRQVVLEENGRVAVTMTPTFSGCPALQVMEVEIAQAVKALGVAEVVVYRQLNPAWSSDWITDEGRAKLKQFGLQPPARHGGNLNVTFFESANCPRCGSANTSLKNSFGSTLCRAIWYCHSCQEPFEQFKPL